MVLALFCSLRLENTNNILHFFLYLIPYICAFVFINYFSRCFRFTNVTNNPLRYSFDSNPLTTIIQQSFSFFFFLFSILSTFFYFLSTQLLIFYQLFFFYSLSTLFFILFYCLFFVTMSSCK